MIRIAQRVRWMALSLAWILGSALLPGCETTDPFILGNAPAAPENFDAFYYARGGPFELGTQPRIER